jgi:glycosyltransferase involved in cell wall biosynthesis
MGYTSAGPHIVHLSFNLARPKYTSPERWLEHVAFVTGVPQKLVPFGKQTEVYNIHYKGELEQNGVRYIFPGISQIRLRMPFGYGRLIKSLKPDVVIVHGLIFPLQVIILRNIIGPHVKFICQHHAERPYSDFRKYIFRWADKYISAYLFASKSQGEDWVIARQISSISKVHEIMGTSSIFYPEYRGRSGRIYLWIGDLDTNKDPLLAARAFAEFSKNHPGVELYMIFQRRQLENELRQIAAPNIHLIGKVEHRQLQDWFNKADFIISASHYEGSGIAVCEALSCGCIPILTNIPSFRMMTGNGKIGRLFEVGDEKSLLRALEETSGNDQSKQVIDYFNAELSFEANARKIMEVVNSL